MRTNLRMKCSDCSHWNSVHVKKIVIKQLSLELDQQHKRTEKQHELYY
jgi:hypothetical protein